MLFQSKICILKNNDWKKFYHFLCSELGKERDTIELPILLSLTFSLASDLIALIKPNSNIVLNY